MSHLRLVLHQSGCLGHRAANWGQGHAALGLEKTQGLIEGVHDHTVCGLALVLS